jgi:glycolate oxidase FAD binding subunit
MARCAKGSVERLTIGVGEPATAPASAAAGSAVAATPAPRPTDVAQVRDLVRDAIDRRTRLRIVGRGTWLEAGRPVLDAHVVRLDALTGIVDYTPGDLTLTARAGTTLAEISDATAAHGQMLALAPWGGDGGSLGAAAATASAGPMSGTFGTPRDIVIGLEAVTGTGDIIRGGGRVVKNVAGFDLTRLMIGAWGTLGVLTEVSVRLRGLPERDVTVALAAPNATTALADLLVRLRTAAIAPIALEIVDTALVRHLGIGAETLILARLAGNDEAVTAQREALTEIGDVNDVAGDVWARLRVAEPPDASVVRLSSPVGRLAEMWATANRLAAASGGFGHASILRAVARVVMPHANGLLQDAALEALQPSARDVRIFERLPSSLWPTLAPNAASDALSRGVRTAFDPHRLLNPGILGDDRA